MPVKMKIHITNGWKNEENERFGPVVVVQFYDVKTGKVLFQYAPQHSDKDYFDKLFKFLWDYDMSIKNLRSLNIEGANTESGCSVSC